MSKEERCIVCRKDVPKSTMRRRLYSEATKHVVPVLHEIGGDIFPVQCVSSILPNTDATFLCRPCFRDAEKLLRLRKEVSQLESQFAEHLTLSGEQRGFRKSAPTAPRTPPLKQTGTKQPYASAHPALQGKRPAQKRPATGTKHGSTPTRPRRASPSPSPPTKRLALGTPSKQYMKQTHVTRSPAVAVSVQST